MKDLLRPIVENKKVVIVGPSPHLENKRLGSLIDSYDIVCRINEIFPENMEKGDNSHVYRGLRHRMLAVEDTELFEFSTQHFDSDSYRIEKGD